MFVIATEEGYDEHTLQQHMYYTIPKIDRQTYSHKVY